MLARELLVAVGQVPTAEVTGRFYRHSHLDARPLQGSASGGRWGPEGTYSVLYLGRPPDSVIIEAYRHLVDDDEDGLTGEMVGPRRFSTIDVDVTCILDLRTAGAQRLVGLNDGALRSDVDDYAPCRRVGQAAHQLGLHGVIATAATGIGDTLALFDEQLPAAEQPMLIDSEIWPHLPADPRRLHLADDQSARQTIRCGRPGGPLRWRRTRTSAIKSTR